MIIKCNKVEPLQCDNAGIPTDLPTQTNHKETQYLHIAHTMLLLHDDY